MLNVRIWVEALVLEYEPSCVAKTPENFQLHISKQERRLDADTKENTVLEKVWGKRFSGDDANKGVDVLGKGGL